MTRLQFSPRPAWLTREEQHRYQIDQRDLGPQPPDMIRTATRDARAVMLRDVWYEQALDANWVAAYRLHLQDGGTRLVVGELRIFPAADPREPYSGRWLADVLGSEAPVPQGGLGARTVRQVTLRGFVPHIERLFRALRSGRFVKRGAAAEPRRLLDLSFAPVASVSTSRRGRPPKPDAFYATVAVLYELSFLDARKPQQDVRRILRLTAGQASGAIAVARRRGWLTPTKRGRIGGHASLEAKKLDAGRAARLLQRLATAGGTGRRRRPTA